MPDALARADAQLAKNPKDAQLRFVRGVILTELKRPAEARAVFQRLTEEFPELPEPYNNLAVLYAGEGKQGAALSAYNLAAGLTTFAGPGIATILLPTIGYGGVCWTYAALYVLAFILTLFIRPQQPGFDSHGHRIKKSADSVKEVAAEAKEDASAVA